MSDLPPGTFLCGPAASARDQAAVREFAAALAQPTGRQTKLALLELMAANGDKDAAEFLANRPSAPAGHA